jgi:hypothetical protein
VAYEILIKSRSTITAQASGALTADIDPNSATYTGGLITELDNTYDAGTENCQGAFAVQLYLDVTVVPTADAVAEIWYAVKEEALSYTRWRYSHTVPEDILSSAAAMYDAGLFYLSAEITKLAVKAVNYGFTSTLYAVPKLYERQ